MKIDFDSLNRLKMPKLKPAKRRAPRFVYFLLRGEKVIYIGATVNVESRVRNHMRGISRGWKKPRVYKKFNSVYYMEVDCASDLENALINRIPTQYNNIKMENRRRPRLSDKRIDFLVNKYIPMKQVK